MLINFVDINNIKFKNILNKLTNKKTNKTEGT